MVRKAWFQENLCVKSSNGLKKRDRPAIVPTKRSKYILPIYCYVLDTYEKEIISQTNLIKMANAFLFLFKSYKNKHKPFKTAKICERT